MNPKKMLVWTGALEIIIGIVSYFVSLYYADQDAKFMAILKAGGSEAKIAGAIFIVFAAIYVVAGLLAILLKGKARKTMIFLGIILVFLSFPNFSTISTSSIFDIVAFVVSLLYFIAAFQLPKPQK